jgi:hypothetical protein
VATTIAPPTPVIPPVIPRLERLPLEALGWDDFEAFCRDLISRQPNIQDCHHFGKQGDAQLGIDLFANFVNGTRWAFQNKRWKEFGPADAEKTILATTYQADRYVKVGEVEGTFWRSGKYAYYADKVGLLTLDNRLLKVGAPDTDMFLGWFNNANKEKPPVEAGHFLGVHVGGPTRASAITSTPSLRPPRESGPRPGQGGAHTREGPRLVSGLRPGRGGWERCH